MPESLEVRRKRIAFRCRQRGMLETSLLLRAFSERHLPELDVAELDRFEVLLDAEDDQLLSWIVGREEAPPQIDRPLLEMIKNFRKDS